MSRIVLYAVAQGPNLKPYNNQADVSEQWLCAAAQGADPDVL